MRNYIQLITLAACCLCAPNWAVAGKLLQSFQCTGMMKSLQVFEDETRQNGRQIKRVYVDSSIGNEFVTRVSKGDYVQYRFDGEKEEIRYYPSQRRLEFWEGGTRVPDQVFAKCIPDGEASASSGVLTEVSYRTYDCGDEIVTVTTGFDGRLRLKHLFHDGTSSEDFMTVSKLDYDTDRWISEESLRKESSPWGKAQGPDFRSFHARYHKSRDEIRFWSQGGGKQGPANMHTVCTRKK